MINNELINPKSIVVIGGSANTKKPGGRLVRNLLDGHFKGELYTVNTKEVNLPGVTNHLSVDTLPDVELAILSIPSSSCVAIIKQLAEEKHTKAFIIISAGFAEETEQGAKYEKEILEIVNKHHASLIGPNCIGLMNTHHHSVFTLPIPNLDKKGVDFISSSGAMAVYMLDSAILMGLRFNSIWSVGNAAQTGVEDVLEYMDKNFDIEKDPKIKLLYIETIKDPDKLLHHASSLIKKGCKIAAIKSGSTESGIRAASSHTGAIASSDLAVEALFRKAGIVRCFSREELTSVACIFTLKEMKGKNFAIVTQAGGPAIMLTDSLTKGGMNVPDLNGPVAEELKSLLLPGAAVGNPIDIIGTGTPDHLATCIDFCDKKFEQIDAIAVIFGSTGLVKVFDAYEILHDKMEKCSKPIFPILPSIYTAENEVEFFINKGHVNFSDEVTMARAIAQVFNTPQPSKEEISLNGIDIPQVRRIIDGLEHNGYQSPEVVQALLRSAGLDLVPEFVSSNKKDLIGKASEMGFPIVAKVVGPVHKTDIGGVVLNIKSEKHLELEFDRMINLPEVTAVMIQPMLKGTELFIGAKYEPKFGHIILCGLGGIFVEVLGDVASGLAPLNSNEALSMIRSLKAYKIIKGVRGQKGINEDNFAEIIVKLSTLLRFATEIKEMDINPLLATENGIIAVDARIRIEKNLHTH